MYPTSKRTHLIQEYYICYWLVKHLCANTFGIIATKDLVLYSV